MGVELRCSDPWRPLGITRDLLGREFGVESKHGEIPFDWLIDVPLFVSRRRVESLYNAVALPEAEEESRDISSKAIESTQIGSKVVVEGSAETGPMVTLLTKLGIKASAELNTTGGASGEEGVVYNMRPICSPERRLLNTCLVYMQEFPERCWYIRGPVAGDWMAEDRIEERPRMLVFLDILPDTPIVPMAAELDDGAVRTFFDSLNHETVRWGEEAPPGWPNENDGDAANRYWRWYRNHRDSSKDAMKLMERVISACGRPIWVDYRVPVASGVESKDVTSLHLDIQGAAEYSTGDFAHRLVHRGRKHGLRIVGLLKKGPALNVLAVYEC